VKKIGIIGNSYIYPRDKKVFVLKSINENGTHFFECGHWCTDNVFQDLKCINAKQTTLF
jgi:hypothetical protein